jgi:hypothetical protein
MPFQRVSRWQRGPNSLGLGGSLTLWPLLLSHRRSTRDRLGPEGRLPETALIRRYHDLSTDHRRLSLPRAGVSQILAYRSRWARRARYRCAVRDDGYFDEPVAATYDEDAADRFDPAVLAPTVDFLAELAGTAARSSSASVPAGSRSRLRRAACRCTGSTSRGRWWRGSAPNPVAMTSM